MIKKVLLFIVILFIFGVFTGCSNIPVNIAICGNEVCEQDEEEICPSDCEITTSDGAICGNEVCEQDEEDICPSDCEITTSDTGCTDDSECGGYICDIDVGTCYTDCTDDRDCGDGYTCNNYSCEYIDDISSSDDDSSDSSSSDDDDDSDSSDDDNANSDDSNDDDSDDSGDSSSSIPCSHNWECDDWGECESDGFQTRICYYTGTCYYEDDHPGSRQECDYIPVVVSKEKEPEESCNDKIKNQGERGVDCGGPCTACQTTPIEEEPSSTWMYLLAIILLLLIAGVILWHKYKDGSLKAWWNTIKNKFGKKPGNNQVIARAAPPPQRSYPLQQQYNQMPQYRNTSAPLKRQ